MSNRDIYATVFDAITREMEEGRTPWVKPWRSMGRGNALPYNAVTGRPYSGGNVFALWFAGMPYGSTGWVTFKQAIGEGCVVRKGEKGTPVYYMSTSTGKKDTNATPETDETGRRSFFFAKQFTVFNVDQLDELEPGALETLRNRHGGTTAPVESEFLRNETADQFIAATGADIRHGGDRAFYVPTFDRIQMPPAESFDMTDGYYGTLFHELGHWTGHESRLNRITPAAFGSPDYAFEELVAELSAALLSAMHGMDTVTQSAAYLRSWAKACRQSPDMFARAASLASKAVGFLSPVEAEPELLAA